MANERMPTSVKKSTFIIILVVKKVWDNHNRRGYMWRSVNVYRCNSVFERREKVLCCLGQITDLWPIRFMHFVWMWLHHATMPFSPDLFTEFGALICSVLRNADNGEQKLFRTASIFMHQLTLCVEH